MTTISVGSTHTPDGVFTVVTNESAVLASGWTAEPAELLTLVHPELRGPDFEAAAAQAQPPVLQRALAAVDAYYQGDHQAVAAVPVHQQSGPFRQAAWEALRRIRPGELVTYTQYAARAGSPRAVRAAAGACAVNAAALFVPCHRVIRTDGSLGGFRYGLEIKESLLHRETPETEVP